MNLKQFINDRITELDTQGKKAALNYFASHIPNLTRSQLNGWRKSGKFPFEVAEAIFENEFVPEEEPVPSNRVMTTDEVDPVPNRTFPNPPEREYRNEDPIVHPEGIPAEEATYEDPNLQPSSPFETADGMTLAPALSNFEAPTMEGRRSPDIRVLDPTPRPARIAPGPRVRQPHIDAGTIAAVAAALQAQGWSPPAQVPIRAPVRRVVERTVERVTAQAPAIQFRPRNWNEPAPVRQ